MAGDWIKMRKCLLNDTRIVRIMSALNADRFRTIGGIFAVWCLIDEQTNDGLLEGYTAETLDEFVGFPGIAKAMENVGWLEIHDGYVFAPDFDTHNGKTAKRRAQESVRKMSARDADKKRHREEKRREEKNTNTETSASAEVCPAIGETPTPSQPSKDEPTEFVFECTGKGPKSWTLPRSKLDEYLESYPGLDVLKEIKKARQWTRDNPSNRKTAAGMPAFLTRWLNKAQNTGGTHNGSRSRPGPVIGPGQSYDPNHRGTGEF